MTTLCVPPVPRNSARSKAITWMGWQRQYSIKTNKLCKPSMRRERYCAHGNSQWGRVESCSRRGNANQRPKQPLYLYSLGYAVVTAMRC